MAKDITYGLDYYKFIDLIDSRIESVKSSLNYQIFKDDIEVLKSANTGVGLSEITANNWLKQICNLSKIELKEYVDNYKKGTLNPYFFEKENDELER